MFGLDTWQSVGITWLTIGLVATFLLWAVKGRKAKPADKPGIVVNLLLVIAGPITGLLFLAAFMAARRAIKIEKRKADYRRTRRF